MRTPQRITRRLGLLTCALALVATGCPAQEEGNGVAEEVEGLQGAQLTVGSKQFDEQVILGQMAVIALEAAGADVTDRTALAGTVVVREALLAGEIDMYWEYTGTAWADIFGQTEVIGDPDELLEAVRQRDQEENGIVWGERAEFENTYAIAQNQQTADEFGVETLSDLAELSQTQPEAATVCIAEEFATRDDGFPGMSEHYGMEIPEANITLLDEGVIYSQVAAEDGDCNFGMVFTTDGRIGGLDLVVLDDDESFFPEYNPAITIRQEVVDQYPEVLDLMNEIIATLDTESMQELNLRAAEAGELPADIARDWLEQHGII